MKKNPALLLTAVVALAVGIAGSESEAMAGDPAPVGTIAVRPAAVSALFTVTAIKGTIKVPAGQIPGAPLNGWNCDDLNVAATSTENNPPPPGGLFGSPKWSKSKAAVGNWSGGSCTFVIPVQPGKPFVLTVNPSNKDYPCDYIGGITIAPYNYGMPSGVPKGTTANVEFTLTGKATCEKIG